MSSDTLRRLVLKNALSILGRSTDSVWMTLAQAMAIVGIYCALGSAFYRLLIPDEQGYFGPAIVLASLSSPVGLALVVLLAALLVWRRRDCAWSTIEGGRSFRWFLVALGFVLAWAFSTYDFNHYFGQWHLADRLLLVFFAVGMAFHPAFCLGLIAMLYPLADQFEVPMGRYSYVDKKVAFDILLLVLAGLLARCANRDFDFRRVLFLVLCLVAASYFLPGVKKIQLGWIGRTDLTDLLLSQLDDGWLIGLSAQAFARAVRAVELLNLPIQIATAVLEVGAIVLLWRRWLAVALLIPLALMHVGIFTTSGICFWKWVLIDAGLVVVLVLLSTSDRHAVFNVRQFVTSLFVIGLASFWFHPVGLGWYDSPLSTVFRWEAVGESGQVYEVPPQFMSPYDVNFAQNRFYEVSEEPEIVKSWEAMAALQKAERLDEVDPVMREWSKVRYDPEDRADVERFLRGYFASLNGAGRKRRVPRWIAVPHHIWTYPVTDLPTFDAQEPVTHVRARIVSRMHFGGGRRETWRDEVVLETAIPE